MTESDEKKKALEKLLMIIALHTPKNFEGLTPYARLDRMKNRAKNIFSLIDFYDRFPDLYQSTLAELKEKQSHLSFPDSRLCLEDIAMNQIDEVYDCFFEMRVRPSSDIAFCLKETHALNSFFEEEGNLSPENSRKVEEKMKALLEKTENHWALFLMNGIVQISEPETFHALQTHEIESLQKSFDYVLENLGVNDSVNKMFDQLHVDEESNSLSLIGALGVVKHFLQGHLDFRKATDTTQHKEDRRSFLESAIKNFEDAGKNILSKETLAYLKMNRFQITKLAHDLGVENLQTKKTVNLMNWTPL